MLPEVAAARVAAVAAAAVAAAVPAHVAAAATAPTKHANNPISILEHSLS